MVDELDCQIIRELQKNGRQTYAELAEKVAVVEGTARKRVKSLLKRDIMRIAALPNLRKLGYPFVTVMGLQVRMTDLLEVADKLSQDYHICYLAFVSGRYDLIAMVITRTPEEFVKFIQTNISTVPSIERTETFVNLHIVKGEAGLPDIAQLLGNLDISSLKKTRK